MITFIMSRGFHPSRFSSSRFRAEKEEVQLRALSPPTHFVDPKQTSVIASVVPAVETRPKAAPAITAVEARPKAVPAIAVVESRPKPQPAIEARTKLQPAVTAFSPLQQNKKSLVVNGNGQHRVRTMISREAIEQNGLHL